MKVKVNFDSNSKVAEIWVSEKLSPVEMFILGQNLGNYFKAFFDFYTIGEEPLLKNSVEFEANRNPTEITLKLLSIAKEKAPELLRF